MCTVCSQSNTTTNSSSTTKIQKLLLLCVLGSTSHQSQTTSTKRPASPLARYLAAPFYRRQNETNYVKVGHLRPEFESRLDCFALLFPTHFCHPRTSYLLITTVASLHCCCTVCCHCFSSLHLQASSNPGEFIPPVVFLNSFLSTYYHLSTVFYHATYKQVQIVLRHFQTRRVPDCYRNNYYSDTMILS